MQHLIIAVAIAIFPTILHMNFLFGFARLERIKTGFSLFDELFNNYPLVLSLIGGVAAAISYLTWYSEHTLALIFAAVAAVILLADVAASAFSFYKHVSSKRK